MKRFFIVAGESSGDAHAARLMRALRDIYPDCVFAGIGGHAMAEEGLRSMVPLSDINVVGFWEVAKKYTYFKELLRRCARELSSGQFDAFLPVDYPGFNLRLAAAARKSGIPVVYYIAPQLWAWGAGRARKMRHLVDLLLVVFPFEEDFFAGYGIPTRFVGHPLLEAPAFISPAPEDDKRENCIALLPGSRAQEVSYNLPLMLACAEIVAREDPGLHFAVATAPHVPPGLYSQHRHANLDLSFDSDSRSLMRRARAGIVKTGTSTLEAALSGMPFVMAYRTSWLSYQVARRLVRLERIALVNIVAQGDVVREFIQREADPAAIAAEVLRLVQDKSYRKAQSSAFLSIRRELGASGASQRAAGLIADLLT